MPKSIIVPAARKVKPGYDPRGKISCGFKNEKGNPQSTDYFVVDPFEEIVKVCGKKPTKLLIYFPPCIDGNYSDWFFFSYNEWSRNAKGVGKLKVKCDRAVYNVGYRVMIDGVWKEEKTDYPCRRKEDGTGCDCKCNVTFGAWVADPFTPPYRPLHHLPIKFTTGSDSNGQKLLTWLELRKNDLLGLPFVLSVHMGFNGTNKFPVWTVTPMEHSNSAIKGELTGIGSLQIENKGVAMLNEVNPSADEIALFNSILDRIEGAESEEALAEILLSFKGVVFSAERKARLRTDYDNKLKELVDAITPEDLLGKEPVHPKGTLIRDTIKQNLDKNNHIT
jgi:hypothetical protein